MEGERKRSKGSFFQLFDWNVKSRKKLFAKDPEFPEGTDQGKENIEGVAKLIELDVRRVNSSNRGSSEFSCTSSVTSDDGFGSRAPGVVARLMGLDSLPTSSVAEPSSTPFSGPFESRYDRSTRNLWSEYNPMEYIGISSNQEGVSWNSSESRPQKVQNRPIERFQTETLPLKSAKSIPITHHKLLSPIKSPGFIPRKNTAYIMEAAAKIIEASPEATTNGRVPSISSSSVPLRIRDLKQKMEAANTASRPRRSNEPIVAKNRKGQVSDRWQSGSEGVSLSRDSMLTEKATSDSFKNKGKSVSLAVKSNVRRKEGATSRNTNTTKQKEIRSNQSLESQLGTQKTKRTSEIRTSNMLRQNNQKQNCRTDEASSTLKNSVPKQPRRKAQSIGGSVVQSKTVHRVALKSETMSKKMHSVTMDSEKDRSNGITLKKQPVNGDHRIERNVSIKCNIEVDRRLNTNTGDRKDGMDVVSFTFTSPVKRAAFNSQPSTTGNCNSSAIHGLNIIGADALGALLEEKLRELTNRVELSHCSMIKDDVSVRTISDLPDFVSTFNTVNTIPAAQRSQFVIQKESSEYLGNYDCLSTEGSSCVENVKWQDSADMEECSSSSNFSQAEKDHYRHPSPVSILEPSFESGSCSNTNETYSCSLVQVDEVLSGFSASESLEPDGDIELSDSATSISAVDIGSKYLTGTFTTAESKDSTDWELDYVRVVLNNAEKMLKDFGLRKTSNIVAPQLFHQIENQDNGIKENEEEYSKLGRKVLFDCVSECLDLMSRNTFVGSSKSWAKLRTVFERKEWLAGKLWKEISGWKNMGDLMVDELVDKDMSTRYGNWLEFNVEMSEQGVEIEKEILTCLVDELVSDIFIL